MRTTGAFLPRWGTTACAVSRFGYYVPPKSPPVAFQPQASARNVNRSSTPRHLLNPPIDATDRQSTPNETAAVDSSNEFSDAYDATPELPSDTVPQKSPPIAIQPRANSPKLGPSESSQKTRVEEFKRVAELYLKRKNTFWTRDVGYSTDIKDVYKAAKAISVYDGFVIKNSRQGKSTISVHKKDSDESKQFHLVAARIRLKDHPLDDGSQFGYLLFSADDPEPKCLLRCGEIWQPPSGNSYTIVASLYNTQALENAGEIAYEYYNIGYLSGQDNMAFNDLVERQLVEFSTFILYGFKRKIIRKNLKLLHDPDYEKLFELALWYFEEKERFFKDNVVERKHLISHQNVIIPEEWRRPGNQKIDNISGIKIKFDPPDYEDNAKVKLKEGFHGAEIEFYRVAHIVRFEEDNQTGLALFADGDQVPKVCLKGWTILDFAGDAEPKLRTNDETSMETNPGESYSVVAALYNRNPLPTAQLDEFVNKVKNIRDSQDGNDNDFLTLVEDALLGYDRAAKILNMHDYTLVCRNLGSYATSTKPGVTQNLPTRAISS